MISEGSRDTETWSKFENAALSQEYILHLKIYSNIYIFIFYFFLKYTFDQINAGFLSIFKNIEQFLPTLNVWM